MNVERPAKSDIHENLVVPMLFMTLIAYWYQFSQGKEPWVWGITFSFIGVLVFLKAKLMNYKFKTNMFFFSWVSMLVGYLLAFYS